MKIKIGIMKILLKISTKSQSWANDFETILIFELLKFNEIFKFLNLFLISKRIKQIIKRCKLCEKAPMKLIKRITVKNIATARFCEKSPLRKYFWSDKDEIIKITEKNATINKKFFDILWVWLWLEEILRILSWKLKIMKVKKCFKSWKLNYAQASSKLLNY
jgi:hypothetical protein